ncbi:hypothetical protein K3217_29715 [bacterium BD-1]|nr:hypothetical protein [Ottowia caeni]
MADAQTPDEVVVSLPRAQKPLPPSSPGSKGRFESFPEMIRDAWKDDPEAPDYAWARYSLSVGIPLSDFTVAFRGLANITHAFGRRVLIHPVRVDHHEIEIEDFDHLCNPQTGRYEIEVKWRRKRCDGGAHIFFAVGSTDEEVSRDYSPGLDALDALEALVRLTLGAMTVVKTRRTVHIDIASGAMQDECPRFRIYGPEERPRVDSQSIQDAIDLAELSASLPHDISGRLALGLRWADIAFKSHDLLAYWTAIEVLADRRGHAVYPVLAHAYGIPKRRAQTFAKELGLDSICRLRGELAHDGVPLHIDPQGESYLNGLVHDLARHLAGLPCRRFAQTVLQGHRVEEWLRRDGLY